VSPRLKAQLTRRVDDLENQALYSSVPAFYDFLQNRVLVQFKPRNEEQAAKAPEFELMLSKKQTYDIVGGGVSATGL
jgi:ubiquitin carboxyl-terminal hydrolase 7